MSKFKVGDLITDKKILIQIMDFNETYYTIKYITGYHQGKITNAQKGWLDNLCVKYDLDNPLTKTVKTGKGYCYECSEELYYGDECVRYDDEIFCCESCLEHYIQRNSEDSTIDEYDLDDSSTAERPLFDLTKEQIEEIKKDDMSKELEALARQKVNVKELRKIKFVEYGDDFNLIEQALKRNEPMKPIYEKDGTRSCPCCKANWLTPNFKFCSDCGQKLKWSNEEEHY